MKQMRWLLGSLAVVTVLLAAWTFSPGYVSRWSYLLLFGCFLAVVRILRGPTAADRIAAVNTLGIIFTGFCGVLAFSTRWDVYGAIALAWALQSFIGTLALAKHLEGRALDE